MEDGLIVDFVGLKSIVEEAVLDKLDHTNLNDLFENPSAENIAIWIWGQLKDMRGLLGKKANPTLKLYEIYLCESPTSCVTYRGK